MSDYSFYKAHLEQLSEVSQFRELTSVPDGVINLSGNDYLGLTRDTALQDAFFQEVKGQFDGFCFSAASSRLLTGNHRYYDLLEELMTQLFCREAALIFNSGYHANIGILPALCGKKDLILADRLVHASLIDGIRLSGADFTRYRHLDMEHLEGLLKKNAGQYDRIFIVTESLFSMDGDVADLKVLVDLKEKYGAFLYVDEAHAIGVLGSKGLGLAEAKGVLDQVDFLVGTFGKAIASVGAYLICEKVIRDFLVNNMRSLIFSTGLPPINVAWTHFVMERLHEFQGQRKEVARLGEFLRETLKDEGFQTAGSSQIVPAIIGENEKAVALSRGLCDSGFWALPIRYPTVPKGTARLRFSLHSGITEEHLREIVTQMKILQKRQ